MESLGVQPFGIGFSLSIIPWRFIQVVLCINSLLLSITEQYSMVWRRCLYYSPVELYSFLFCLSE